MKRLLALLLAVVMLLSLCACGNNDDDDTCRHKWQDATCTEPKTCTKCGITRGEATGHEWVYNDDIRLEICRNCVVINTDTPNEDSEGHERDENNDGNVGNEVKEDDDDVDVETGELLFKEPFFIECVTYEDTDATRSNSEAVKAIRIATNVYLSYKEIFDFDRVYPGLLLIGEDVPDLTFSSSNKIIEKMVNNGHRDMFFDLYQYMNKMPNVKALMDQYPEAFSDYLITDASGTHMYALPVLSEENGKFVGLSHNFAVGRDADIGKMCKFLNWMYSDFGVEVTNWGLRGEHYTVNADGKKEYTPKMHLIAEEANTSVQLATCFGYPGIVAVVDKSVTGAS